MSDANRVEQRIRSLFDGLSPAARALVTERLQAAASGQDDPGLRLALVAAAASVPEPDGPLRGNVAERVKEAFFAPLTPFLVSGRLMARERGRVEPAALNRLWAWFQRDLGGAELATFLAKPLAADAEVEAFVTNLRPRMVAGAREMIAAAVANTRLGLQKLAAQVGGDRVLHDLGDVLEGFDQVGWVAETLGLIPPIVTRRLMEREPDVIKPLGVVFVRPDAGAAWLFSALLASLESPGLLAWMASALAGSGEADQLGNSPARAAVDILLSEIERVAEELRDVREHRGPVATAVAAVARIHQLVHELELAVDLPITSAWGKRLAHVKTAASSQLELEVGPAAGLVRRVLRPRSTAGNWLALEPDVAEDATRAVRLLAAATEARESLALHTALTGIRRDVDQAFEALLPPLLGDLRIAVGKDREVLARRSEAAVSLAELYFGADYAAALRRSRQAALGEPARKDTRTG